MTTARLLSSVALAAALLVGAYLVLPRARGVHAIEADRGDGAVVVRAELPVVAANSLVSPVTDSVVFVPAVPELREVATGDTLGTVHGSLQRRTRAFLLDAVERGRLDSARLPLPESLGALLAEIGGADEAMTRAPAPPTPDRPGFVLRGWERDLVEADLMGAEDGLRDQLAELETASTEGASPATRKALASRVRERRRAVRSLRARLAERLAPGSPVPRLPPARGDLSQRDRARLLDLAESLPPDTSLVLSAAAAGTFVPKYSTSVQVEYGAAIGRFSPSPILVGDGGRTPPVYHLVAESLPTLWAVADRVDTLGPHHLNSLVLSVVVE